MSSTICACIAVMAINSASIAQPSGSEQLRDFWNAAARGRVDVVMIGDSTQVFGGHGWDEGWNVALHERFGLYATGVHSAGENAGDGAGIGWECATAATRSQGQFSYSGAPSFLDVARGPEPLGYLYVAPGATASSSGNMGMSISAASPLDVSAHLLFHYTFGRFSNPPPGHFRPVVRLNAPPFTTLTPLADIPTGGPDGFGEGVIDLPPATRTTDIAFRWAQAGGPAIQGPFFGLWMRCERPDRTAGVAVSTLYASGGKSARDAAEALFEADDAALVSFFTQVRALQSGPRHVLVRISFGVNDRNETLPSLGPRGVSPGDSPLAYRDNLEAIMDRLRALWASQGWDSRELFFVLTCSPPIDEPDDAELVAYRDAADEIAIMQPQTAAVRFDVLANEEQMLARGWYNDDFDRFHFSREGFRALSRLEIDSLISGASTLAIAWHTIDGGGTLLSSAATLQVSSTIGQWDAANLSRNSLHFDAGFWSPDPIEDRCPADYNQDGGIDGQDVQAFFDDWENGLTPADVNLDGGIDGQDVQFFFEAWEAGGCY